MSQEDVFKKPKEHTYYLKVVYNLSRVCNIKQLDSIFDSGDLLLCGMSQPDEFTPDPPTQHYCNLSLDQLIAEIYAIAQSNVRIQQQTKIAEFIEVTYTQN